MWFEKLTGITENSPEFVRNNISIEGNNMIFKKNRKKYQHGKLEVISLKELKELTKSVNTNMGKISVSEIIADVKKLHCESSNEKALFQAASQFNLLEMVHPFVTPESGIDRYDKDLTQGPACAIACGAGTIYRNYFVNINNETGQSEKNQIDCLKEVGKFLNNEELLLWKMRNGYALVNQEGLMNINKQLNNFSIHKTVLLKENLKVGIQWNTQVTISSKKQIVSQIYCSALPVGYSDIESIYWENFARIILEATYEATFHAALVNLKINKSNKLFLTLVGGGVFGNEMAWIVESLEKVINKFKNYPLEVKIVSYGESNPHLHRIIY